MTRVVCQQLAPQLGDLAGNRERIVEAIRASVGVGASLIVLPELATSGFVFDSAAEARPVAIAAGDPLFDEWAAACGSAVVVGGFLELGDDGRLYNGAAVVDDSGPLGFYRKLHLWDSEKRFLAPGSAPPRVLETKAGRVGVIICYDMEFPEITRMLALEGAEILAVPVNWPLGARPVGERPQEVVIAQAAARVNRIAIACCDRTGTERGQEWTAGTTIVDANGWVAATEHGEGAAVADLDLSIAREKRIAPLADLLADRRPELYSPLSETVRRSS